MNPQTYRLIVIIALFTSTAINYSLSNPTPGSRSYSGSSINWGGGGSSSSWHK